MPNRDKICIVGLGYVGLTLAVAFAKKGLQVHGVEINKDILNSLENKKAHFSEVGLDKNIDDVISNKSFTFSSSLDLSDYDTYIVTVGTPLNELGVPRTDMVERSIKDIGDKMKDGATVILRSTVKIGTTRKIAQTLLNKTGKKFHLAMCPERSLEGDALNEMGSLPQIIGANNEATLAKCISLFSQLTPKIISVSKWETAEMIKLVDNISRDVNFAFANEVAALCNEFEIDCYEVIQAGKTDYPRTNVSLPGPVGGPCLEKDGHILINSIPEDKQDLVKITKSGRYTNENQLNYIFEKFEPILNENSKILFAGLAFKGYPETDDLRGSMGIRFLNLFKQKYSQIYLFDPIVQANDLQLYGEVEELNSLNNLYDCIFILNNHSFFKEKGPKKLNDVLSNNGFIFDFWKSFNKIDQSNNYFQLGNLYNLKK
jgi:UDP-N-acetyl-D-mannosaminuronic acid dehydrogenase